MKVLITGSSGLVGSALANFLAEGHHQVYRLVREKSNLGQNEIAWDPDNGAINSQSLEKFNAVVHLAGENIVGKWTEDIFSSQMNNSIEFFQ